MSDTDTLSLLQPSATAIRAYNLRYNIPVSNIQDIITDTINTRVGEDGTSHVDTGLPPLASSADVVGNINAAEQFIADTQITSLDKDWAARAFLVNNLDLNTDVIKDRYYTSAKLKYTDSRLGCNIGINARPQFTRYSDIRIKGLVDNTKDVTVIASDASGARYGMGRYYSEAIDDNHRAIYLRFGVPQFNSITSFFASSFDTSAVMLARQGRVSNSWATAIGSMIGTVATFATFPIASLAILGTQYVGTLFKRSTSKFYSVKPTMYLYWQAVSNLVNVMALNRGILPRGVDTSAEIGIDSSVTNDAITEIRRVFPDMFIGTTSGYDIQAMANRANMLAMEVNKKANEAMSGDVNSLPAMGDSAVSWITAAVGTFAEIQETLRTTINNTDFFKGEDGDNNSIEKDPRIDTGGTLPAQINDYLKSELNAGTAFAVFRVDESGSVTDSFSNSAKDSGMANGFNSMSMQSRDMRFNIADGNLTDNPLGNLAEGAVGALGDATAAALNAATFGLGSALTGLLGNGFIDVPKHWDNSTSSIGKVNYTMQLISPYGNPISQMQNIYIPLAMILAGVLPLATGKQSYTAPFLTQVYDRGRSTIQLGIIDSVTIRRGTCNLPFTNEGRVMAIDVDFSISDLSSICFMPVATGLEFLSANNAGYDSDNMLSDYLSVLAGQSLYAQIYSVPKAMLRSMYASINWARLRSPAFLASVFNEHTPVGMLEHILPGNSGTLGVPQ